MSLPPLKIIRNCIKVCIGATNQPSPGPAVTKGRHTEYYIRSVNKKALQSNANRPLSDSPCVKVNKCRVCVCGRGGGLGEAMK